MANDWIPPSGLDGQGLEDEDFDRIIGDNMRSGQEVYDNAFNEGLKPDPSFTVTQWADEYRQLPRKGSVEPGKYRSSRTPYMREIMDELSPYSGTQDVVLMKATQIGATAGGENWICHTIDLAPAPMMMVLPTEPLAKDFSKQKLTPTIEETPALRGKVKERRAKDSGNTILAKEFFGGILFLIGSNSGAGFRQRSIKNLFLDDIDGFADDVNGEGDPVTLARKRTDAFGARAKVFECSTPTVKDASRIEKSFKEGSQAYYHVPCPHCGEMQVLEFGGKEVDYGIKFVRDEDGQAVDAWYQCKGCRQRIDEHHKGGMLERGEWVHEYPKRPKKSYQISSLYSPLGWVSWLKIVQEFLDAKDDMLELKAWTNTRLSLPFEEYGDQPEWSMLRDRAEQWNIWECPPEVQMLTAGVDVQGDRLSVLIQGWKHAEELWNVWWGELFGDPNKTGEGSVWAQLDGLLARQYGEHHHILSCAVDTGHNTATHAVYNYCRFRGPQVIAVKGQSQTGKPVIGRPTAQDVNWRGVVIKNGVQLWPVGTDVAKATIYSRLRLTEPGPGYWHFPQGLPDDFFVQLTAERLVTEYDPKGFPKQVWKKIRDRNEALDCAVYSYAAAIRAGLHALQPKDGQAGQHGGPHQQGQSQQQAPPRQQGGGWLNSSGGGWFKR